MLYHYPCTQLFSLGVEQNGVPAAEPMDIPPPLPVKGNTGDYGNVMDYQEFIQPAAIPPAPQRVSLYHTASLTHAVRLHYYEFGSMCLV